MQFKIAAAISLACISFSVFSQDDFSYKTSSLMEISSAASVKPTEVKDFRPNLVSLEMPDPGGDSYQSFLLRQKEKIVTKPGAKKSSSGSIGTAEKPIILAGFPGNEFDGSVPTDNHIAISNGGKLISVANSTIYFYDANSDIPLDTISLESFFDTLQLPANKYDPRVLYDPKQDRFVIVCLSGSTDSTSNVVLAFSSTADPLDDWHLYALPGDPLNQNFWSDFPMIAMTDNELFITVNELINDTTNLSDSWKYLFQESVIWQIRKNNGYNGQPLQTKFYSNIYYNNRPIRNICPIQGGSTTYGPNIFLLSNRNFDLENDTFFVLEITNVFDDPQTQLKLNVRKSSTSYGLAPDGKQDFNRILMTNDSRVLSGFYENGKIHFVMNSVNPDTVRSAVYHGIVNDPGSAANISGTVIGYDSLDIAYPSIAYTGKFNGDEEAVICFNHTSVDSSAGFSAIFFDADDGYSPGVMLKSGESWVGPLPGLRQRWGDYTGAQRKYNEPGKVWLSGFYGIRLGVVRANYTLVAAVESPDSSITSVRAFKLNSNYNLYPNPAENIFHIEFEIDESKVIDISLFDMNGILVKKFIHDKVKKGKNLFSFSAIPLPSGNYLLIIADGKNLLDSKKIVKH